MGTKSQPFSRTVRLAWAIMLLASLLPDILQREFLGGDGVWLIWTRVTILIALLAFSFFWQPIRPLRAFIALWLVIFAAMQVSARLNFSLRFLQKLLGGCTFYKILSSSFFSPAVQSRRENKVKCFSYKKTS